MVSQRGENIMNAPITDLGSRTTHEIEIVQSREREIEKKNANN
jgi:hypothetical protein